MESIAGLGRAHTRMSGDNLVPGTVYGLGRISLQGLGSNGTDALGNLHGVKQKDSMDDDDCYPASYENVLRGVFQAKTGPGLAFIEAVKRRCNDNTVTDGLVRSGLESPDTINLANEFSGSHPFFTQELTEGQDCPLYCEKLAFYIVKRGVSSKMSHAHIVATALRLVCEHTTCQRGVIRTPRQRYLTPSSYPGDDTEGTVAIGYDHRTEYAGYQSQRIHSCRGSNRDPPFFRTQEAGYVGERERLLRAEANIKIQQGRR